MSERLQTNGFKWIKDSQLRKVIKLLDQYIVDHKAAIRVGDMKLILNEDDTERYIPPELVGSIPAEQVEKVISWLSHGCLIDFVKFANKLLASHKIAASCPTSIVSKHYTKF